MASQKEPQIFFHHHLTEGEYNMGNNRIECNCAKSNMLL